MKPPTLSLSANDVQAWRDACVKIEWEKSQLDTQLQQLRKKIAAAEVLMGGVEGVDGELAPQAGSESPSNWVELVLFALRQADGGRTQRHVLEVGRTTPMAPRVKRSPNGLYNAVSRLLGRGDVIKHGDLLYLPSLWESIKSGEVADNVIEQPSSGISMADEILRVMADGKPRAPRDIVGALSADAQNKLNRNPQYGYTTLSRLAANGQLRRKDGIYSLPQSSLPENVTLFTGLRASDAK